MINIINALFQAHGFNLIKGQNLSFYHREDGIEQYWIVTDCDVASLLDRQPDFFAEAKKMSSKESLDKNLSMIVLWETDGKVPREDFKRNKMRIEEDPYFFKKYVLGYSRQELDEFKNEIAQEEISKFVAKNLISKTIFEKHKDKPFRKNWISLLYRLAIKVPFLKIEIGESQGLQSLIEENNKELQKNGMLDASNFLMDKLSNLSDVQIKNTPPDKLYEMLLPIAGEA